MALRPLLVMVGAVTSNVRRVDVTVTGHRTTVRAVSTDVGASGPELSNEAGFTRVDDQSDTDYVVATMDQTARWPATIALRAFEAERLDLRPGQRLLDVGCGRGEVACALAPRLVPGGSVVGIDASEAMLADARRRAGSIAVGDDLDVTFRVGDATAIDEPDESFDAVRSERMLQWLEDPAAAVAEMVRVLRPGGRFSLIDSDWRTLVIDLPDLDLAARFQQALVAARGRPAAAGGLLANLVRAAGLVDVTVEAAAHTWTAWDPDTAPAPSGLFPLAGAVPQLVEAGVLDAGDATAFLNQAVEAGRSDRFFMSLTVVAVAARTP